VRIDTSRITSRDTPTCDIWTMTFAACHLKASSGACILSLLDFF
jgi:hypothetical protein